MTLQNLDIIGFASIVETPTLPRVLAPVCRDRTSPDSVILPPFTVIGDEVFNFHAADMAEFGSLVAQEKLTRLPAPIAAKVNHDLWVNSDGQVTYEPKAEVKKAFQRLFKDHLALAEQCLSDKEYEAACQHAAIARAVNPVHLDPLIIRAVAERSLGQNTRFAFTRHLAEDIVTPAEFDQLIQARMSQGIVNDVNKLLGPVTARLTCILSDLENQPRLSQELGLVLADLRRASQCTTEGTTACRVRAGTPGTTNLVNLIKEVVDVSRSGTNVNVRVNIEDGTDWVMAEPVKVGQVLQNLVMNGIQAMPTGGFMDVEARNRQVSPGGDPILLPGKYVEIIVRDRGCGIAPENLGKVFHASFTTKADGNGIGLTTCKRFIDEHHGDIRLKSIINVGTEFTVLLPAVGAPVGPKEEAHKTAAPIPRKHGKGSVLIVDDDYALRHVARMILKRCGYEVTDCDNGQDAIEHYRRMWMEGNAPDVVLMELTIRGGLNGCEAAAEILRLDSQARLVVTSGSVNEEVQMIFLEQGFIGVLPKPYEAGELTQTVHRIVSLSHDTEATCSIEPAHL